jgi:predicted nucleic acid-binding protein
VIYLDTSATVKLVTAEPESPALINWLNVHPDEHLVTSVIGHVELIGAATRAGAAATAATRKVASTIDTLVLTDTIGAIAATLPPAELRTLDAIHLATAHAHRHSLTAFCLYDRRPLDAAKSQDLPTVSPLTAPSIAEMGSTIRDPGIWLAIAPLAPCLLRATDAA